MVLVLSYVHTQHSTSTPDVKGETFQDIGSMMGTSQRYHVTNILGLGAIRVGQIAAPSAHKYTHIMHMYSEIDAGGLRFSTFQ